MESAITDLYETFDYVDSYSHSAMMRKLLKWSPRCRHPSRPVLRQLSSVMRICRMLHLERVFPLSGPKFPRPFAVLALELVGHPEQRAVNYGPVIAVRLHNAGFDDEAAEFDQMPCALAAFDLPYPLVMPRPCRACAGHAPELGT